MPERLLRETLDGLKENGEIQTVGFSGGESFLYLDLLQKGLTYAKKLGFSTTVATNGFWGEWPDEKIITTLTSLAPDHISFSTDVYHRPFVSDDAFGRAVFAAKALKIACNICIGEKKDSLSGGSYFKSMGDYKYLSLFSVYPYVPAGRARSMDEDSFFRYFPLKEATCDTKGSIAIRYDGRVYPCCSPYVFDTALSLGNVNERAISTILADKEGQYMFDAMRTCGFGNLIKEVSKQQELRLSDPCTDGCEVCHALFSMQEHYGEFKTSLEEQYGRMAADHLLGRSRRGQESI
jgi:MoaA/NifB/PqqE/SkfB family radical SAM enzyme